MKSIISRQIIKFGVYSTLAGEGQGEGCERCRACATLPTLTPTLSRRGRGGTARCAGTVAAWTRRGVAVPPSPAGAGQCERCERCRACATLPTLTPTLSRQGRGGTARCASIVAAWTRHGFAVRPSPPAGEGQCERWERCRACASVATLNSTLSRRGRGRTQRRIRTCAARMPRDSAVHPSPLAGEGRG